MIISSGLLVEIVTDIVPLLAPVPLLGTSEVESNGDAVLAPDIPNAMMVIKGVLLAVFTMMLSLLSVPLAMAYHSSTENLSRPAFAEEVTIDALLWNESKAEPSVMLLTTGGAESLPMGLSTTVT
jgi:hypothetical protein